MKPYRFSLERVMQWREEQADAEHAAMRRLVAEQDAVRARQTGLRESAANESAALARRQQVEAERLLELEAYKAWVRTECTRLDTKLRELDGRIGAQRVRVVEAQRKVRLLEKLKEKSLKKWHAEFAHELEELAAEAYLSRWKPT